MLTYIHITCLHTYIHGRLNLIPTASHLLPSGILPARHQVGCPQQIRLQKWMEDLYAGPEQHKSQQDRCPKQNSTRRIKVAARPQADQLNIRRCVPKHASTEMAERICMPAQTPQQVLCPNQNSIRQVNGTPFWIHYPDYRLRELCFPLLSALCCLVGEYNP
jgi:hypothetical protein